MSQFARFLLCLILLITVYSGAPTLANAQEEVPPPDYDSESVIPETTSVSGADVVLITDEVAGTLPSPISEEMDSLNNYRLQNSMTMLGGQDYYSVAGSVFQPRNNNVKINYSSGGCIYRTGEGGSEDQNAFTAPVNLPDGAVILGVRFFGYDASANDAALHLISFNGAGDLVDNLNISSSTSGPGYFSAYGTLTTPITINNANQATSLVWYPYAASSQLLLCGARILYIPPFPPAFSSLPRGLGADQGIGDGALPEPSRVRNFTTFIAGHDFLPRNAASSYMYGGAGCIASSSGGMVVADADLPEGASLYGVRLFYYDVSATSGMSYFTTTYDGFGNTNDILSGWVDSETPGYSSFYNALSPAHLVNQLSNSMVVQAQLPLDINVRLCGMQLLWSMPVGLFRANTGAEVSETDMEAPHPPDSSSDEQRTMAIEYHYRFIAGSAFQPRSINTIYTYNMAGCVRLNEGMILTADLQLPAGALLRGVRVYTYDTSTGKSTLFTTDYNWVGGFNEFLIGDTAGSTGYSQTFFEKIPSYTVDTFKPIALVWNGGGIYDGTMQLCGMRVFYSIERNLYGTYLPMIRGQ